MGSTCFQVRSIKEKGKYGKYSGEVYYGKYSTYSTYLKRILQLHYNFADANKLFYVTGSTRRDLYVFALL